MTLVWVKAMKNESSQMPLEISLLESTFEDLLCASHCVAAKGQSEHHKGSLVFAVLRTLCPWREDLAGLITECHLAPTNTGD